MNPTWRGDYTMNVICGNDVIDISKVYSVLCKKIPYHTLLEIEQSINGNNIYANDVFSDTLLLRLKSVLNDFSHYICRKLPEPQLTKSDLDNYRSDYKDLEKISNWRVFNYGSLSLKSATFDDDGDASILWSFMVQKHTGHESDRANTTRIIKLSQIIPILDEMVNLPKPKNAWSAFWSNYSYKDIQSKLKPVLEEYLKGIQKINLRISKTDAFIENHKDRLALCVELIDGTSKIYLDGCCGFDIFLKESELLSCLEKHDRHQQKLKNSNNDGEKRVEYAIKWFMSANDAPVISIKNDCESHHRYNCIVLCKPDFTNEPQEYDHILICSAGVILIETKHWKGQIEIRKDGKWVRKSADDGSITGVDSPKFQMRRHEVLMQKILPSVPVHSILCFSNASTIIDGQENFTEYPIISIEQLEETLNKLCSNKNYTADDITQMASIVESYKILFPDEEQSR